MPPPTPRARRPAAKLLLLATFLSLSTLLLLLTFFSAQKAFAVVAVTPTTAAEDHHRARALLDDGNADAEHAAAVDRHCAGTLHQDVCVSTLSTISNLAQKPLRDVISDVVGRAASAVRAASANCTSYLRRSQRLSMRDRLALSDCLELFGHTLDQLGTAAAELSAGNHTAEESIAGVQTVLSAAMTNQYTCLDGFSGPSASDDGRVQPYIQGRIYHVAHLVSNSLAMLRRLPQRRRGRGLRARGEAFEGYGRVRRGFPSWVSSGDRRRLQQGQGGGVPPADAVVAKDGSGNFTTVSEAVAAAPNNSDARTVIRVKAGTYEENVEVPSYKTNIALVGEGRDATVITGSRSAADGWTTFRTATVGNQLTSLSTLLIFTQYFVHAVTVGNQLTPSLAGRYIALSRELCCHARLTHARCSVRARLDACRPCHRVSDDVQLQTVRVGDTSKI